MEKWGYIRETPELVKKAFKDNPDCEVGYTCATEYLKVIFPNTDDWIQRKSPRDQNGKCICNYKPDFFSPSLNLIIEIDGLPHYTNPENVIKDKLKDSVYSELGYKVVRIPYFIQLDEESIDILFGVKVDVELFDIKHPSLGIKWKNTPAYLCPLGIKRMIDEFKRFPKQYRVNLNALRKEENQDLAGVSLIENLNI